MNGEQIDETADYERVEYAGMVTPTELRNIAEGLENSNHASEQLARRYAAMPDLMAALRFVEDILGAYEGSEEPLHQVGRPVIWINAQDGDGDLQTMLRKVRAAIRKAKG